MSRPTIVYGNDPLCGWCYGFRPALATVREALGDRVSWRVECGGLVVGERVRPIREMEGYLRKGMMMVEERTGVKFGKPFSEGLLAEGTYISNSEPVCRAVQLVQELAPERTIDFADAMSFAFYGEGMKPDQPETLRHAAARAGVDADALLARWAEPGRREWTEARFAQARARGVRMYPSLFIEEQGKLTPVVEGCPPVEQVLELLEKALGPSVVRRRAAS